MFPLWQSVVCVDVDVGVGMLVIAKKQFVR